MTAAALPLAKPAFSRSRLERMRAAVAAVGAAVLGAAPHVLHHVGPLAGAAVLAGASGKLLFGALGFLLAVPMLRGLHRHYGSWIVLGGALALMAVVFAISTFVIGPAISGAGSAPSAPTNNVPAAPAGVSPSEHGAHHR